MARFNPKVNVVPVPRATAADLFPATTARVCQLEPSSSRNVGGIQLPPAARVEQEAEKSLLKAFQHPVPPLDFFTWQPSCRRNPGAEL